MTEKSYWWTTGGAGDGASTYTRVDLQYVSQILANASHFEGVVPNYLDKCTGAPNGANTFSIGTGGAVVDGKPYRNDASVNVNIPSAVGSGNTRIDRVVLRADWTAQTVRITRIAGTDAAEPTPPSITQSSGSTYDIKLYQVLVNESGTVSTELDERIWAYIQPLIGQFTESYPAGDHPYFQIAGFGVEDTHLGEGAPTLSYRKGGDASAWATPGGTSYNNNNFPQIEVGVHQMASIGSGTSSTTISYPTAYSSGYAPLVNVTVEIAGSPGTMFPVRYWIQNLTNTGFKIWIEHSDASSWNFNIHWIAIGKRS